MNTEFRQRNWEQRERTGGGVEMGKGGMEVDREVKKRGKGEEGIVFGGGFEKVRN